MLSYRLSPPEIRSKAVAYHSLASRAIELVHSSIRGCRLHPPGPMPTRQTCSWILLACAFASVCSAEPLRQARKLAQSCSTTNYCKGKTGLFYANPCSSSSFILCSMGQTYVQACPAGLLWDTSCTCCNYPKSPQNPASPTSPPLPPPSPKPVTPTASPPPPVILKPSPPPPTPSAKPTPSPSPPPPATLKPSPSPPPPTPSAPQSDHSPAFNAPKAPRWIACHT